MPTPVMDRPAEGLRRERWMGLLALLLAPLPALAAVWLVPGFVTQDGPAHLYNAHVLTEALRHGSASPFADVYAIRLDPLPNWAGHLVLVGQLYAGVPASVADKVSTSLALLAFTGGVAWLRVRVAGWRGLTVVAPIATVLGLNMTWLLGFTSFLLGAALFPVVLGVWWGGRERPGARWGLTLAALLTLGYFGHLVSLGLTVGAMLVLCVFTPGPNPRKRWGWTLGSLLPLVPLGVVYRRLMRGGGAIAPIWGQLSQPFSLRAWKEQLGWVDPITLGGRFTAPFVEHASAGFILLWPTAWFALGVLILLVVALRLRGRDGAPAYPRRGWLVLAALMVGGGIVSPDSLGLSHGYYLSQRIVLLGLVALVPLLDFGSAGGYFWRRFGGVCLVTALALQSAHVWDYAKRTDRLIAPYAAARDDVGRGRRIGGLFLHRARFRANPLMHADCLLGIGTGNVVWSNYEAAFYYFPVQVRPGVPHPPILQFEAISILTGPDEATEQADRWAALLDEHASTLDAVVIWGDSPPLIAATAIRYEPAGKHGPLSVWQRRDLDHGR